MKNGKQVKETQDISIFSKCFHISNIEFFTFSEQVIDFKEGYAFCFEESKRAVQITHARNQNGFLIPADKSVSVVNVDISLREKFGDVFHAARLVIDFNADNIRF